VYTAAPNGNIQEAQVS